MLVMLVKEMKIKLKKKKLIKKKKGYINVKLRLGWKPFFIFILYKIKIMQ